MSLRSQRSEPTYTEGHLQGDNDYNDINTQVNDADVYNYALRVVLLQHIISHKPVPSTLPSEAVPGQSSSSTSNNNSKRDSSNNTTNGRPLSQVYSTTSSSWSSSWSALSLSDVFRSSSSSSTSSSSPRYPERFIKVLEHRIESISRGVDKVHTDLLLRYTVGAFYGKFKDPKNARLIKETRKLEDLLMLFIATATDVLRKRCAGSGDNNEWKWRLEIQLEAFVDILEACLRHKDVKHVPPELLSKLDTLKSKISANRPSVASTSQPPGPPGSSTADNTSFDASTSTRTSIDMLGSSSTMSPVNSATSAASTSNISYNVADIPEALQLGQLFGIDHLQLQRDVNALRKICTEKNALVDLKQCINLISMNAPFPACREDFNTEEAYREWRSSELASLQQEMLSILQRSPELVKAAAASATSAVASSSSLPGGNDSHERSAYEGNNASSSSATAGSRPHSIVTEAGEAYVGRRISKHTSLPIAEQFATMLSMAEGNEDALSFSDTAAGYSTSGTTQLDSRTSSAQTEDTTTSLTFVSPTSARLAYTRLLEIMLSHDLEAMADLDPSEEVPLRILSKINQHILNECVSKWRISDSLVFVAFLKEMSDKYAKGEMPVVECVTEALADFDSLQERIPAQNWPTADHDAFLRVISQLLDALLRGFYETYSEQLPPQAATSVYGAIVQLSDIPLFEEAVPEHDLSQRLEQLKEGIRRVSDFFYDQERSAIFSHDSQVRGQASDGGPSSSQSPHEASSEPSIEAYLDLLAWVKASGKRFDKAYRAPLFATVDVPGLFLEQVVELYIRDLGYRLEELQVVQKAKPLYTTPNEAEVIEKPAITDGQVMALYRGVKELTDMHKAFCPQTPLSISLNEQFEPYILRWLAETDTKTLSWVRQAINLDDFKPSEEMDADKHSSSIVDLVASCKGALQFVNDLDWPDEYQNAVFVTRLASTISKAIEQYCAAIEELFMREVMPPKRDNDGDRDERTSAWLTRAKALYQDKKLEMFKFQPTSCLKLNNMHAARELLDKMYTTVEADRIAAITRAKAPPLPAKSAQSQRNLFTVKIVLGEGLSTADGTSRVDPFVTLSDERGMRIAKTRTLYETKEPRWAETFDISVEGKMWIAATIWNRNLVDEHELLGRTYIALDPAVFGDFLPHDLWQDLDTAGRLLLRVSMEGEKDDIQFFFGRAFRSLKRAENDMTRIIVDKISPFIRSSISMASLRALLKKGGYSYLNNLNLEKAFERARLENGLEGVKNLKNLIKARDPNAPLIPLPPSSALMREKEKTVVNPTSSANNEKRRAAELTDAEIEEPLAPLLEYLEQTLYTFRKYLSDSAWQSVMTKIWKEVINVVEGLLVPALSDQPTEMKPLSDKEVDIVFKWLRFLTDFFHAEGSGVPIEDLHNARYQSIKLIRLYYDWTTDDLMRESVNLTNQQLVAPSAGKGMSRSKSVYQQRNLGTIKQRKQEKQAESDSGAAEMVMRVLRMRPDAHDFLQQQMGTLHLVQEKQKKPTRLIGSIRGRGRGRGRGSGGPGHLQSRLNTSLNRPLPTRSPVQQSGRAVYQ